MAREKALENSELNIKYAAGYLKYFQSKYFAFKLNQNAEFYLRKIVIFEKI